MPERQRNFDHRTLIVLAVLILLPIGAFVYKVTLLGYSLEAVLPRTQYDVVLTMDFDASDERVRISTFAPADDEAQDISEITQTSTDNLRFEIEQEGLNQRAVWRGVRVPDGARLRYEFKALVRARVYTIHPDLEVPESYPRAIRSDLEPTDVIQVDDPDIRRTLREIGANRGPILARLEAIYALTEGLESRAFKGTTDALTALRLGEASCNGKSRLFVALARAAGIPTRLVGRLGARARDQADLAPVGRGLRGWALGSFRSDESSLCVAPGSLSEPLPR